MTKESGSWKKLLRNECIGWQRWEVVWLLFSCLVILLLSLYWKDSLVGIISAVSGVACVACTGKGKLSAYGFGLINVLFYAAVAFSARYYGEVMLNLLYYLPMQFYGFRVWSRNMDDTTHEVKKRKMQPALRLWLVLAIAAATVAYGFVLRALGGALPFVDAFTTVASVATMVISVKMYLEQWMLWLVVDLVTVFMWIIAFANGSESVATLLMWLIYLVNAVVMHRKWAKEINSRKA